MHTQLDSMIVMYRSWAQRTWRRSLPTSRSAQEHRLVTSCLSKVAQTCPGSAAPPRLSSRLSPRSLRQKRGALLPKPPTAYPLTPSGYAPVLSGYMAAAGMDSGESETSLVGGQPPLQQESLTATLSDPRVSDWAPGAAGDKFNPTHTTHSARSGLRIAVWKLCLAA